MSDGSDFYYFIRDRNGDLVAPSRLVSELREAIALLASVSSRMARIGLLAEMRAIPADADDWAWRLVEAQRHVDQLLGLEPAADGER